MKTNNIFHNWHIKIICFLLAVLTVYFVTFGASTYRTVKLPLKVIMPENFKAVSIIPESVDLIIQGGEDIIYMIKAEDITLYADFSSVLRQGVSSMPVQIDYPFEIEESYRLFLHTNPSSIRIYFEAL